MTLFIACAHLNAGKGKPALIHINAGKPFDFYLNRRQSRIHQADACQSERGGSTIPAEANPHLLAAPHHW
jgi:hypothetical protein